MVRTGCIVLLLLGSFLGLAACGGDNGNEGGTTAARDVETSATPGAESEEAPEAKANVEPFLLQAGEEPGFEPVEEPRTDHGVQSLVGGYAADEVERLRRAGFISITFQPLRGDRGNAGVTTILLFETAEGARDWLEYETSDAGIDSMVPGAKPKRFSVPGVPGARGWTGRDRHGNPIGHVFWVQGRCEMLLGNEGEGDFVEPLSIGAKAIYDRTKGLCPA
jgi:hypothetical protein